jgi:hypothetical protein
LGDGVFFDKWKKEVVMSGTKQVPLIINEKRHTNYRN